MSNIIKNTLMAACIVALLANIVYLASQPFRFGPIEARRPEAAQQPTYRAALTRQIHVAYGVELSRLHRELPDLLAMQLRIDGLEKAIEQLRVNYGPEDDWIDEHGFSLRGGDDAIILHEYVDDGSASGSGLRMPELANHILSYITIYTCLLYRSRLLFKEKP